MLVSSHPASKMLTRAKARNMQDLIGEMDRVVLHGRGCCGGLSDSCSHSKEETRGALFSLAPKGESFDRIHNLSLIANPLTPFTALPPLRRISFSSRGCDFMYVGGAAQQARPLTSRACRATGQPGSK